MLVGDKETCKVTDFGMARDVQQESIYERKTKVLDNNKTAWKVKFQLKIYSFNRIGMLFGHFNAKT